MKNIETMSEKRLNITYNHNLIGIRDTGTPYKEWFEARSSSQPASKGRRQKR
jgi:hypothetical protein